MPRFLFTITLISAAALAGLTFVILKKSPEETGNLILFFALLWTSLAFLTSLPIYVVNYKLAPRMSDLRAIYRKSFKISVFIATAVTAATALKAFNIFSPINLVLLVVFLASVYKLISKT